MRNIRVARLTIARSAVGIARGVVGVVVGVVGVVGVGVVIGGAQAAQAARIDVNTTVQTRGNNDGDCSLGEAIVAANTNAAVDGCAAGDLEPAVDVISVPAGDYVLSAADVDGAGLPTIA